VSRVEAATGFLGPDLESGNQSASSIAGAFPLFNLLLGFSSSAVFVDPEFCTNMAFLNLIFGAFTGEGPDHIIAIRRSSDRQLAMTLDQTSH